MRKIITAVGNQMLNNKCKQLKDYIVIADDIENDEELIECLQREKEIDFLFLCSNIIHNYNIDEFIEIIQSIQEDISIIFFKGENIESSVQETGNLKIYNALDLDLNIFEKIIQKKFRKKIKNFKSKIISISGCAGVGKSVFSTFFAKTVENTSTKTLLIDLDLEENQLRTILKIKKQPEYKGNIKDIIINIDKNLDVLCYLDYIFSDENKIDFFKIQKMLNELKQEYNLIIIDTSSNIENEYTKLIFYNSDDIIFLLEPNILGIKKSKNMLEVFENDWKISNEKIKLILNKTNMYDINNNIIEELFPDKKIVGKMKYMDGYNLMLNKDIHRKEIKKEYKKICGKVIC